MSRPPAFPSKAAEDFDPEVMRLFDQYVHGQLDRRGFLDRVGRMVAGGTAAAAGLLAALSPNFALAQKVASTDARIKGEFVEFASPSGHGKARAYVARPAQATGLLPVVLVVHENRGLNPHIEDVTRRLALENFIAVAPDALFPLGGYPGDADKGLALFGQLEQAKTREDLLAAAVHARGIAGGNGRLGAVGFCWGGSEVNALAARMPELRVGVPFYGSPPPLGQVGQIKAELLFVFAENDPRINTAWPPFESALKASNVRYEATTYPGTQHGFHNDTTSRFNEAAAKDAWARTLGILHRTLRS